MRGLKDFILDYWREVLFVVFIGAFLFFFMGYRTKSNEINELKTELKQLRDTESNIVNTGKNLNEPVVNDQQDTSTPTTDTDEVKQKLPEGRIQYSGFNIKTPPGWINDESIETNTLNAENSYVFINGSRTIELDINPVGSGFSSDTTWEMESSKNTDNPDLFDLNLLTTSENLCTQGTLSCTFGDGRLQVGVKDTSDTESLANRIFIYFVDTNYIPGGDSFSSLKEFISTIQLDKK